MFASGISIQAEMKRDRSSDRSLIDQLCQMAKLYSRRAGEADDLVQDLLLEAVRVNKDFSGPQFMAWGRGFLRNRAAFVARTEGRRRKREHMFHENSHEPAHTNIQFPETFISSLRPSLRTVARLMNCGLNRKEINISWTLPIQLSAGGSLR